MSITRSCLLYLHHCCVRHCFRSSSWVSTVVGWIEARRDQRKMAPRWMIVITLMQVKLPLNKMCATVVDYIDWWEIKIVLYFLDEIRYSHRDKISSIDISYNVIILKNPGIWKVLRAKWSVKIPVQFNWKKVFPWT